MSLLARPRIGLALGGGAARGLAHVGVLRVLEEEGFPVDLIVGTSIGALVGGAYVSLESAGEVEARFRAFAASGDFKRSAFDFIRESRRERNSLWGRATSLIRKGFFYGYSLYRVSFISAESLAHNINSLLPDIDVGETRMPFAAVAADLTTGAEVVVSGGSLRTAVRASCAIPGVLPPVSLAGRTLIDGGWVDWVPALPAMRLGADVVIGVDIAPEIGRKIPTRGVDVMVQATSIQAAALKRVQSRFMDHIILPEVSNIHWADFTAIDRAIRAGEEAARAALPELQKLVTRGHAWMNRLRGGGARRRAEGMFETLELLNGNVGSVGALEAQNSA